MASRALASAGSSSGRSGNIGAKPAAVSITLRSRGGTASSSARRRTMARLGAERPVSMKLRCRQEISASHARSSWLKRRRRRQARMCSPTDPAG